VRCRAVFIGSHFLPHFKRARQYLSADQLIPPYCYRGCLSFVLSRLINFQIKIVGLSSPFFFGLTPALTVGVLKTNCPRPYATSDYAPRAIRDLQRLVEFLRPKNPVAAKRAVKTIMKAVQVLETSSADWATR
jgi:hypothetical protein